ncbi:MAG: RidA family protein [Rikenellaceae bacterium]
MMPNYKYTTIYSDKLNFFDAINDILSQLLGGKIVRMVFFEECSSNDYYCNDRKTLHSVLKNVFCDKIPAWSLVGQKPLDCSFSCEVCEICDDDFNLEYRDFGVVVNGKSYREIVAGNISADPIGDSIEQQCRKVFLKVDAILKSEDCKVENIVRQWNYIENITLMDCGEQNYQLFNNARSLFYEKGDWSIVGYPAATGIGTAVGGIVLDFNAIVASDISLVKLDNELQIAAHDYSDKVLLGSTQKLTTPKFERGKAVCDSRSVLVYISGTAAIRGEKSLKDQAADAQIKATMENINFLIGVDNLSKSGVKSGDMVHYSSLRVYVKHESDYAAIKSYMDQNFGNVSIIYLHSDVCRDELLVEVEGIAIKNNNIKQ